MLSKTKKFLNDIQPGTLNFIGSRPGIGKSTLALNFTRVIKENILLINLESTKVSILDKLNMVNFNCENVFIDTKCCEENDLFNTINEYVTNNNVQFIIIDYIQLIKTNEDIKDVISKLKELAKKLNAKIILLSQLSSVIDKRDNNIPLLEDAKYNEFYDNIGFLYNDNTVIEKPNKKNFNFYNITNDITINYELDRETKKLLEI